ncbi:hypothetical protein PSYMO_00080, partial [Pseudomonas amygdali pv. mori str. 301020]
IRRRRVAWHTVFANKFAPTAFDQKPVSSIFRTVYNAEHSNVGTQSIGTTRT